MTIKIGIIGAGGMARYHVAGFRAAGAEVIEIGDASLRAAKAGAKKFEIPQTARKVPELLANPELDAVSIIVPNKFHAPLAISALEAGKHVFCEKPPALNAKQVQKMLDAQRKSGKTLMFNFNNRARPESFAIMKEIRSGTFGTINSAQSKWIRRTGIPGFGGWFTTKSLSGGGPLIDLLHMIDLAHFFMGNPKPRSVLGQVFNTFIKDPHFKGPWGIPDKAGGKIDVESAAHGFVTFETGQVLSFQTSWAEMVKREEVSVNFQGTKAGGKIERLFGRDGIDETAIDTCEIYSQVDGRPNDRVMELEPCEDMGRTRSAKNFVATIEGREAPLNTPDQALSLMQIIDACYKSAQTGKAVVVK
jgi:predicted dehydrogenase